MSSRVEPSPPRALLDGASVAPEAARKIAEFHAAVVREVQAAVSRHPVVVVGMAQNPHVRNVRRALSRAGIEHHYLEYGSYLSQWKQRLAVKLWSGWPTLPQVFVRGVLIGGEDLTVAAIEDGRLQQMLSGG